MDRAEIEKLATGVLGSFLAQRGRQVEAKDLGDLRAIGLDSLSMAELIFEVCEAFGIDDKVIDDASLRSITSLDSLVDVLTGALPLSKVT